MEKDIRIIEEILVLAGMKRADIDQDMLLIVREKLVMEKGPQYFNSFLFSVEETWKEIHFPKELDPESKLEHANKIEEKEEHQLPEPPQEIHLEITNETEKGTENNLTTPPPLPQVPETIILKEPEDPETEKLKKILSRPIIMPNGRVNEPYIWKFDPDQHGFFGQMEYSFSGLAENGLNYDPEMKIISGIPSVPGDVKLTLNIHPAEPGKPILHRTVQFYVNFDPRSLWTESEPDPNEPYQKPHTDCSSVSGGPKKLIGASKRGRSHAKDGKFRDDDYAFDYNASNGWYVICVGDGAGSAKYSRKGSQIACHGSVNDLKDILSGEEGTILDALVQAVHSKSKDTAAGELQSNLYNHLCGAALKAYTDIKTEAETHNYNIKDFSTTYILSICKKFDFGWFVAGFWIGDGGIGIYTKGNDPVVLGNPDSGEYSGQTRFLTMSDLFQDNSALNSRVKYALLPDFDSLVLMTDGISDAWFSTDSNLFKQEKWDKLFEEILRDVKLDRSNEKADEELLKWLDFWVRGEYDDRTLTILF